MKCEFFSDAGQFLTVAAAFLAEREAENTVALGAALRCRRKPRSDAVRVVVQNPDAVRLVAVMRPPHPLVLSASAAEAIPYLIGALRAAGIQPPGVSAIEPMAERFATLWRDRTGPAAEPEKRTILYRANRIVAPERVPGELQKAAAHDVPWLAAWQRRFAVQAGLSAAERAADMHAVTAARVSRGEMYFWAVAGRRVASAAFTPTTPAGEAERGKGHASACVAALSQRLFDRGWRYCLIFADRDNPTTTRIYPRLGYQEVAGFATIGFRDDG
jgi:uncharacterized protein